MNRNTRWSEGKRARYRRQADAVEKVVELGGRGFSPSTIAASTGLTTDFVERVLQKARQRGLLGEGAA